MEAIVPYLMFNGTAAEALDFYAKALEGEILFKQTYGDSPMPCPDAEKAKIMHGSFQAGDLILMVSDTQETRPVTVGDGVHLSLNFTDVASIDKTFAALSEGAEITMPLQDTFWGAKFGQLTDKFGIRWMFNHDYKKEEA